MNEPVSKLTLVAVHRLLDHRLPDPLRQAAVNLSFHDQRVDQIAGVVDRHQLQQLRLASLAIDFEHRDVAAERIGVVGRLEERFVAEARLEILGQRHRHVGKRGDVGERLRRCRRAFHRDGAVLEDEIVGIRLEQLRGELRHLRLDLAAREVQRRAADGLRSAAERADALFDDRGVAVLNRHVLERHAELIGQHLPERRLVALTVRRGAGGGGDAPVTLDGHPPVLPSPGRKR